MKHGLHIARIVDILNITEAGLLTLRLPLTLPAALGVGSHDESVSSLVEVDPEVPQDLLYIDTAAFTRIECCHDVGHLLVVEVHTDLTETLAELTLLHALDAVLVLLEALLGVPKSLQGAVVPELVGDRVGESRARPPAQ